MFLASLLASLGCVQVFHGCYLASGCFLAHSSCFSSFSWLFSSFPLCFQPFMIFYLGSFGLFSIGVPAFVYFLASCGCSLASLGCFCLHLCCFLASLNSFPCFSCLFSHSFRLSGCFLAHHGCFSRFFSFLWGVL